MLFLNTIEMPVNYKFINKMGDVCSSMNGLASTYCLPIKKQCIETDDDGYLQDCDNKYCQIRCSWEASGEIPFVVGDKLMFQLQFRDIVNSDIYNPSTGWGSWVFAELYDASDDTLLYTFGSDALARFYVCHNGRNSYQVIEIDTADDGEFTWPCSFYFKFYATDGLGGEATVIDERCSHNFKLVDPCMKTVTIEGLYSKYDCLGNYYGDPCDDVGGQANAESFKYSNKTRIEGKLVKKTTDTENEDGKTVIIENYEFTTKYADSKSGVYLPNYLITWYVNLFSAKTVKIDGVTQNISNFAVNYEEENPNSAIVNFTWSVRCTECYG